MAKIILKVISLEEFPTNVISWCYIRFELWLNILHNHFYMTSKINDHFILFVRFFSS